MLFSSTIFLFLFLPIVIILYFFAKEEYRNGVLLAAELEHRKESFEDVCNGIRRFLIGFSKKIILANNLSLVAEYAFRVNNYENLSVATAWVGAISYSLQIYFDFAGYSDMALGLGQIFGFHFEENFNYPYAAKSFTDFWRRWHISLSTWFRDYIYIPLGGSRVSKGRHIFNLLVVWTVTGIWHGAAWNECSKKRGRILSVYAWFES